VEKEKAFVNQKFDANIIVELQGGLGNQLFQYAFYKSLKNKYPSAKIKMDISYYHTFKCHYGLELPQIFNINLDLILMNKYIRKENSVCVNPKFLDLFNGTNNTHVSQKQSFSFYPVCFYLDMSKNYYFSGYWQNEQYFYDIKDMLLVFKGCIALDYK